MAWTCFVAVETGKFSQALRRYGNPNKNRPCPLDPGQYSHHDVSVRIEDTTEDMGSRMDIPEPVRSDPRWPQECRCGYVFQADDQVQVFAEHLYAHPETGAEFSARNAPTGAIILAHWLDAPPPADMNVLGRHSMLSRYYYESWYGKRPPIEIKCPPRNGLWCPDSGAENGPGWQVAGELPRITVTPSISMPGYHSFLTDGILGDDLEGRTY